MEGRTQITSVKLSDVTLHNLKILMKLVIISTNGVRPVTQALLPMPVSTGEPILSLLTLNSLGLHLNWV